MSNTVGHFLVRAWQEHHDRDPHGVYDEVLREVSTRAATERSLGKTDIGALVLWKRITAQAAWAKDLLLLPDHEVRAITGRAFAEAHHAERSGPEAGQAARLALLDLPGMGGTAALASAVLLALAPNRMAVWDRRVSVSLSALGHRPKQGSGFYGRYLATLATLAGEMAAVSERKFLRRDVDLALFSMAGSETQLAEARSLATN